MTPPSPNLVFDSDSTGGSGPGRAGAGLGVLLCDTTLRDGEQAAGVAFVPAQKEAIAVLLDQLGIHEIEAGTPAAGEDEAESVRRVASLKLRARVSSWNRACIRDLELSARCGVGAVTVCLPTSDLQIRRKLRRSREWVLDRLAETVVFGRRLGLAVCVGAEDASRSDPGFLRRFIQRAEEAGACRVRVSDTVGCLDPLRCHRLVGALVRSTPLPLEFHAHDDLGLATANALAALQAGATHLSVTALGLGERAGNAALEEVAVGVRYALGGEPGIRLSRLPAVCHAVAEASGRPIPVGKAVAGALAFTHESGIHADGILKDPATYEAYPPEAVGRRREISLGKHSGRASVRHRLGALGCQVGAGELADLVAAVRHTACRGQRLGDAELLRIVAERRRDGNLRREGQG